MVKWENYKIVLLSNKPIGWQSKNCLILSKHIALKQRSKHFLLVFWNVCIFSPHISFLISDCCSHKIKLDSVMFRSICMASNNCIPSLVDTFMCVLKEKYLKEFLTYSNLPIGIFLDLFSLACLSIFLSTETHFYTYVLVQTYIQMLFFSCMYLTVIYRVSCSGFIKAMISHKMSVMVVNMTRRECVRLRLSVAAETLQSCKILIFHVKMSEWETVCSVAQLHGC